MVITVPSSLLSLSAVIQHLFCSALHTLLLGPFRCVCGVSFCHQRARSEDGSFMRRIMNCYTHAHNLVKPTITSVDKEIKEKNLNAFPSSISPPHFQTRSAPGPERPYLPTVQGSKLIFAFQGLALDHQSGSLRVTLARGILASCTDF